MSPLDDDDGTTALFAIARALDNIATAIEGLDAGMLREVAGELGGIASAIQALVDQGITVRVVEDS